MSIADKLQTILADNADISSAIAEKGVTVPSGAGTSDFADLIAQIENDCYSIIQTGRYSASTLKISLVSKPKIVIASLTSTIAATGIFAYASLNPNTGAYVSKVQTHYSGSTVEWVDVSRYAVWDDDAKTFSMRVRSGTSATGSCTYHAVG